MLSLFTERDDYDQDYYNYDQDRSFYSAEDYAGKEFLDSIFLAARLYTPELYNNEQLREYDPVAELAYKLHLDEGEEN